MTVDLEFGILGPLVVRCGEKVVPVRRGRQRAVLAVLLLNAGRVVPVARLADVLWGREPPPSAEVAIRNYVMRLRHGLGEAAAARICTQPPGYLIDIDAGEFDVTRFEALVKSALEAGELGSWETAAGQAASALALWRGYPLVDVESLALALREVPRLTELRLRAEETRIEAELHCGRHASVLADIERLAAAHPQRENLHAQLVLALYRCGRQADALAAYQRARRAIVAELGIEPGPVLRDVHQRILSGDAALTIPHPRTAVAEASGDTPAAGIAQGIADARDIPEVLPHQLPQTVGQFVGRDRELAELSALLERAAEQPPGTVVISALGGTAGVGKTALAVRWAHQVSGQFPDGQLYVNLRGYGAGRPVAPADALVGFLHALGLADERIPEGVDERAAAFRSLLAGRRVLLLLDNAREAEQVRPLLPGSSSCMVVVTSRDALPGLVALNGAIRVGLDLLPLAEATRLLRELIGDRAAADPGAVARLANCCCRLPLALRVAAELADARPDVPLADLAAELADQQEWLDLLDAGDDPRTRVRAVFSWSRNFSFTSGAVDEHRHLPPVGEIST